MILLSNMIGSQETVKACLILNISDVGFSKMKPGIAT